MLSILETKAYIKVAYEHLIETPEEIRSYIPEETAFEEKLIESLNLEDPLCTLYFKSH